MIVGDNSEIASREGARRRRRRDARQRHRRGARRAAPRRLRARPRRPRRHRPRPGRGRDRGDPPGRGRQLRRLHERRRRRVRRGRGDGGQRHRRGAARRRAPPRSARRSSTSRATTSSTATPRSPYVESDVTGPISAYGRSKQAGETSVAITNPRHLIVRSSWLFGLNGPNFVETMLRLAGEQSEVIVVTDQVGCPTYTRHLGQALAILVESDDYGIHHVAARGLVLVVRVRAGDLRPGGGGVPGDGGDDRDARPAGAAPGVVGPRQRAPRRRGPAALAPRAGRVPGRAPRARGRGAGRGRGASRP